MVLALFSSGAKGSLGYKARDGSQESSEEAIHTAGLHDKEGGHCRQRMGFQEEE